MNVNRNSILPRRTFLRGAAAALALPLLDAMIPRHALADEAAAPMRMGFMYTPNGFNQKTFLPTKTGAEWDLPAALEPLAALKSEVTLVSGLDRTFVGGTGVHAQCGACWLTSSPPSETRDGGFPTNISLDQIVAREIGHDTALPSLELSCNDFADHKETKYFESISWYGPGYAANTEKNPRNVFKRLFGSAKGGPAASVLDAILDEAKSLRGTLGRDDRAKLDEYLGSVRETERRIQIAESKGAHVTKPPFSEPAGIPEKRGDYLRLMGDLTVFAFQQDLTRVATIVVDPERWDSPRTYHGVFDKPQNHHVLTHTKGDEAKAALTKIDRFHVEQFAYIVGKLRAIREGAGSLLDNCVFAMGSGISDGDSHNYKDLQVLLAGRARGKLVPGRHLHYEGERPLADLWLTLCASAEVKRDRFADSTGTLKELLA